MALQKYWTIQHLAAWEEAQKKGILTGNPYWATPSFERAYQWMIHQMVTRLGCVTGYPIWLWTERPDLRHRWGGEKGVTYILLQVTLDEASVLLSDFNAWHCVLNNWVLELYEDEPIAKEESWLRLFDLELMLRRVKDSPDFPEFAKNYTVTVQGVTPAISLNQVKEIKTFTIRHFSKYYKF